MKNINLTVPAAAVTQTSVAVVWDKTADEYEVFCDDVSYAKVTRGDCTIEGLKPGREYKITVKGGGMSQSDTSGNRRVRA